MSFIYLQVLTLEHTPKVGSKQCVALIQRYSPGVGHTSLWQEGETVFGNQTITRGTAIATFVNGSYPSAPHGNHAAYFLHHTVDGFYVMDQWSNDNQKPFVSSRFIRVKAKSRQSNGWWPEGGNNAYAYSVIER